ncbi:DUF3558 domain-containing protein [Rhodococcoides yunnanense]|uniref:DUF3558 domain-containing protein n=1 Tax=Rhodococcoides yunnanense TaxID=278209 RepID=UPI00093335D5
MQRRGLAILSAVLLASACGNGVEGTPVAGSPAKAWDPCSIPAQAIETAGLDSASQRSWSQGVVVEAWPMCMWRGPKADPWYFLSIRFSTEYTLDDARANPAYREMVDTTVQQRRAVVYRTSTDTPAQSCYLALETASGIAKIDVDAMGGIPAKSDPCSILLDLTSILAEQVPAPKR